MASRWSTIDDLFFTSDGDFRLGDNGDIKKTLHVKSRTLQQRVYSRLASNKGDWKHLPDIGVGLTRFVGLPNNAQVGKLIEQSIYSELYRGGLLKQGELKVTVFPVSQESIAALIEVNPAGAGERFSISVAYDMRDNKLSFRNY